MQHILWTNFEGKWMRLMLTKSSLTVSSLMVHQMFKQLEQFCVHSTPVQCVSMEGSMSCPCFSATSPNSNQYRLVLYFLLVILISICHIFCSCSSLNAAGFTMFLGLVPAMAYMPNSLLKLLPSIMERKLVCCVVQELDSLPGSTRCTELYG